MSYSEICMTERTFPKFPGSDGSESRFREMSGLPLHGNRIQSCLGAVICQC